MTVVSGRNGVHVMQSITERVDHRDETLEYGCEQQHHISTRLASPLYQLTAKEHADERQRLVPEGEPLAWLVAARIINKLEERGVVAAPRPAQDRNLVSVSEFSKVIGVSESTIYEWL